MNKPTPLPAIIWDLDKTLVRFEMTEGTIDRWREELAKLFRPFGWEEPFRPLLTTMEAALRHYGELKSPEEAQNLRREIYADLDQKEVDQIQHIHMIEPMIQRLSRWNEQGVPMALVTNNGEQGTRQALNAINTCLLSLNMKLPQWSTVVARAPRYLPKPESEGMQLAVNALQNDSAQSFEQILVIGDSVFDWEAAHKLEQQVPFKIQPIAAKEGDLNWIPEEKEAPAANVPSFFESLGLTL